METLLKADIFFFISSIATIVFTILVSVLLVYLIKAGKNLYKLSETLKSSYNDSEEFITELKERLEDNMVFRMFFPPRRKRRISKSKDDSAKNN
jgi:beta-lactamase regulating signal transducer with metallopeptidase domain